MLSPVIENRPMREERASVARSSRPMPRSIPSNAPVQKFNNRHNGRAPREALAGGLESFLAAPRIEKTAMQFFDNQVIFSQGYLANAAFYIQKGKVKLSVVSNQGKEGVIAILEEGDLFGEGCLSFQPLRISSATAIQHVAVLRLGKGTMIELLTREPRFSEFFLAHLLARNIRTEEDLVDHLFNSSEKRLARTLLSLAHYGEGSKAEAAVVSNISQEVLAEMIGTTRSRVSFFMNRFRRVGFIDYKGSGIQVHNSLF